MNIATCGRTCSAAIRRLSLSWRFVKSSATTPSKIAAHAAHANQVLDPTLVTPCQPLWIHPIESTFRLYHSGPSPELRWTDSRGVRRILPTTESIRIAAHKIGPRVALASISRPSTFATDQDLRLDTRSWSA